MKKDEIIYGIRPVIEALNAGKDIEKVFILKGLRSELFNELMHLLKNNSVPYQFVPIEKLNRITQKHHQGVIAYLSNIIYSKIENIIPYIFEQGKNPFVIALDRITDVRNFGAIARTAHCAGVDAIIIPDNNSVRVNADAIKSSAGALHNIPVCRSSNLLHAIKYLKSSGLQVIACTEKAEANYYNTDFTGPCVLIFGSEENGISENLLKISDFLVRIPMKGNIASLNVSVAAGIILFEAARQRDM